MPPSPAYAAQLPRFLATGAVNTLFGYALYAALVAIGFHMLVAQIVGTIIAVAFNYTTYSRHVFGGEPASKPRFLLSYGLNYLVGLAALASFATVVSSPYLAGLLAISVSAAINFVVLRRYVFVTRSDRTSGPQLRRCAPAGGKADHASCN